MSCISEMLRPCEYVRLSVMVFCGSKITQPGPFTSQMGVKTVMAAKNVMGIQLVVLKCCMELL